MKGACDTHMHFYDGSAGAPGAPNPGTFTVPMYRELQKRLGVERVIVVQPNAYRDDNRVTLESMQKLGKVAKGVAVVKPDVAEAELDRLTFGHTPQTRQHSHAHNCCVRQCCARP